MTPAKYQIFILLTTLLCPARKKLYARYKNLLRRVGKISISSYQSRRVGIQKSSRPMQTRDKQKRLHVGEMSPAISNYFIKIKGDKEGQTTTLNKSGLFKLTIWISMFG